MSHLFFRITIASIFSLFVFNGKRNIEYQPIMNSVQQTDTQNLYAQLHLADIGLKKIVYDKAISGWNILKKRNILPKSGLLTIVDFSQSSNSKRLYIIDLEKAVVVFNTYVSHGRNSGNEFAVSFANTQNSFKSSLGFYVSSQTYIGNHGLSMRLKGLEKGINDDAETRGIVMHGAVYVSEKFIKNCGRLGRSQGCPAVSQELSEPIINCIKNGSCVYMYYPDVSYRKHSLFG